MSQGNQERLAWWYTGGTGARGDIVAPGSGSTVTLWDSGNYTGGKYKLLIVSIYSSHASAANGLQFDESWDEGANWDNIVSYTVAATTFTKNMIVVSAPRVRARYVNSANVLTAWRGGIMGDVYDRAQS